MKHIFLLAFSFGLSVSALAQEVVIDTNYYTPPAQRRQVLTPDPEQGYTPYQPSRTQSTGRYHNGPDSDNPLFHQLKEVQTWYLGAEGGLRSDGSTLTNSFNGLVSNVTQTKVVWSVLLGYTYRNAWAVETGYAHTPIHLNITIANGQTPLIFNYQNSGSGIPLRLKRRIGSGKQAKNGTGFWLTAGAWLIPNGTGPMDDFKLIGYSSRNSSRVRTTDTLRLSNTTKTFSSVTGLAELGVDYSARLSPFLELGAYVRKYWGLSNALRSDLVYTINNKSEQQGVVTANGTGWGFGIALRYIYGRQHEVKKDLK
jgi:hypothetical protein